MNVQEAFAKILPYCPSIAALVMEAGVSEIECNPNGCVFVERSGRTVEVEGIHMPETERESTCQQIARSLGKDISDLDPLLDARLPDGSRVCAVAPPITSGFGFTIRKFREHRYSLDDLVELGTLTPAMRDTLRLAVEAHQTILISGGTSAGKTSLANALCASLPAEDRVVVIEDTAELRLDGRNVFRMEARPAQDDVKAVTIRDLVKTSLRLRPDRIIVGEVRGAEAFDLLQALNSGHAGSMSTIHASSAESALYKLASYAATAGDIPLAALKPAIAEAVHLVVQIIRLSGHRVVNQIVRVEGYHRESDLFRLAHLLG